MDIAHAVPHPTRLRMKRAFNDRRAVTEAADGERAGKIEIGFPLGVPDGGTACGLPEDRKSSRLKGDVAAFDWAESPRQRLIRGTRAAGGCGTDAAASGWLWLRFGGHVRGSH